MNSDHGADPLGDGRWRLVPSGEIVDREGYNAWKRSRRDIGARNEIFGLSWKQLEAKQGGKLRQ